MIKKTNVLLVTRNKLHSFLGLVTTGLRPDIVRWKSDQLYLIFNHFYAFIHNMAFKFLSHFLKSVTFRCESKLSRSPTYLSIVP
jgi:hypothetical protein